jgi:single-stranded-DNA-specific exonuclease
MTWNKTPVDPRGVKELARRYGLDLLTASIVARRGITEPRLVRALLEPDLGLLHNPFLMSGMVEAVERIGAAIDSGERILIFGDRDVDGITATVLLHEALSDLGAEVAWMLPEGEDAYGLSPSVIDKAAEAGTGLLVTVDCGVSNLEEIALAASRGIECIVIDHHNPPARLPEAVAVVDPKLPGYPFRDLCGCAVASKVEWALRFSRSPFFGAPLCLLAARPANGTLAIEAVRIVNLVETARITEAFVPGLVPWEKTRLAGFLAGDETLVLDAPQQARLIAGAFGEDAVPPLSDLDPLVRQFLPGLAGKSLLRIQSEAGTERYAERPLSEVDVLCRLFTDLVLAREKARLEPAFARLDLVTLGTLADLMPLVDENRAMVRAGLEMLRRSDRDGLRRIFQRKDLLGKRISATDIAWQVAPLLNSAGRMGEPGKATRMFLSQAADETEALVGELFALDLKRKSMGESTWSMVLGPARESFDRTGGRFVLVHEDRIPRGITGIMASRLQGFFKAPSIVLATGADPAVGSIRCSRPNVIEDFFARHRQSFLTCGGHDFAGGFSIARAGVEAFLAAFFEAVEGLEPLAAVDEVIAIDAEIPLAYLEPKLQEVVDRFEPYGEGNPPLAFLTRGLRVSHCELIGRREATHLKLLFDAGKVKWPAVFWNAASRFPGEFGIGDMVDIVYRLGRNSWGGGENLQLTVLDLKKS